MNLRALQKAASREHPSVSMSYFWPTHNFNFKIKLWHNPHISSGSAAQPNPKPSLLKELQSSPLKNTRSRLCKYPKPSSQSKGLGIRKHAFWDKTTFHNKCVRINQRHKHSKYLSKRRQPPSPTISWCSHRTLVTTAAQQVSKVQWPPAQAQMFTHRQLWGASQADQGPAPTQ